MYIAHRGIRVVEFQERDIELVHNAQQSVRSITSGIPSDLSITGAPSDLEFLDYLLYETILRTSEDVKSASITWGEVVRNIIGLTWVFLENGSNRTPCLRDGEINITLIDPYAEVQTELLRAHSSFVSLTHSSLTTFCSRSASEVQKQAALKYLSTEYGENK